MGQPAVIVSPEMARETEHDLPEGSEVTVRSADNDPIRIFNYFGEASRLLPGPQGFIVDAPPDTDVDAHWHPVDQFQIYEPTPGAWYHRREVTNLVLHYTDAFSTYGPFGSRGPGRLRFRTLRARATDLTGWMPQDRERMLRDREKVARTSRRNYMIPLLPLLTGAQSSDKGWEAIHDPEPDGLAAYRRVVGPARTLDVPDLPAAALGRFYCVLAGALWLGNERFPEQSLLWQDHQQELPILVADPESGCDLLALQYPAEGAVTF